MQLRNGKILPSLPTKPTKPIITKQHSIYSTYNVENANYDVFNFDVIIQLIKKQLKKTKMYHQLYISNKNAETMSNQIRMLHEFFFTIYYYYNILFDVRRKTTSISNFLNILEKKTNEIKNELTPHVVSSTYTFSTNDKKNIQNTINLLDELKTMCGFTKEQFEKIL